MPAPRLHVESLEDRTTPAVTAVQNGAGVVTVNYGAGGDSATIGGTIAGVNSVGVVGTGLAQVNFANVTGLVVTDGSGSAAPQPLAFADLGVAGTNINLGGGTIAVSGIESVQFNANVASVVANGGISITGVGSLTTNVAGLIHLSTAGTLTLRPVNLGLADVIGTAANPIAVIAGTLDTATATGVGSGNQWLDLGGAGTTTIVNTVNLGAGRLLLNVDALGGTFLATGTVVSNAPGATVTVGLSVPTAGAFFGGNGTVGPIQVQGGSTVGPGTATTTATLTSGSLSFLPGGAFGVKVAGAGGGQFDSLNVIGDVNLAGGLIFVVPFAATPPAVGSVLTVITNDGADAVTGTFAGLAEGGTFADAGGNTYRVSYVGGTGNDVTITLIAVFSTLVPQLVVTGPGTGNGLAFTPTGGVYGAGNSIVLIPGFAGELHAVISDVTGDGVPDGIVGTGPGNSRVRVLDGANGPAPGVGNVLADFIAFPGYAGGVFVAVGDLNGDGIPDLAVTPDAADAFSGPIPNQLPVRVYSGASLRNGTASPTLLASFDGLASLSGASGQGNPAVKLGGRPAIADVNGDGRPDLLIAAGNGGGPRITVWPGTAFAAANGGQPTANPIVNLFVFESTQRGGAFITAGDVNGDRFAEIVVGGGPGGGPRVRIVNSASLFNPALVPALEGVNLDDPANLTNGLVLNNFFAGSNTLRGGVRVTVRDADGDGRADVVVGSGANERSGVRVYTAPTLRAAFGTSNEPAGPQTFDPFGAVVPGGVWVG